MEAKHLCLFIVSSVLFLSQAAHSAVFDYVANLDGPSESTPNASPGTGFAEVTIDDLLQTMRVQVSFAGLLGTTTASHIHAPTAAPFTGTAGVATTTPTFTGFPLGVTSGTYDHTFDLTQASSYNPAFVTAYGSIANAESVLLASLNSGQAYLNIHTIEVPSGEIRGFLAPAPAPEAASTAGLLMLSFVSLFALERRHKAHEV
jgi:hypothetical protein